MGLLVAALTVVWLLVGLKLMAAPTSAAGQRDLVAWLVVGAVFALLAAATRERNL